jgi:type III restriction enzyme
MSKRIAETIAARLSLRPPQRQALTILADVLAKTGIEPGKEIDLSQALRTIQLDFPHFEDFERDFPSLCFALATGVGKTRLMGAFIAYLHATSRIRPFILHPSRRGDQEKPDAD